MVYQKNLAQNDMTKIIKQNGETEEFDSQKLVNSLKRAKAPEQSIEMIVKHIEGELKDGMSTSQIYDHAYFLLGKESKKASVSYSLRRAIQELGPSGFPFEDFIGEIWRKKGFEVQTGILLQGNCTEHEIDVLAHNENKLIIMEAKFHNEQSYKTDSKVALYVKARFDDLKELNFNYGFERKIDESWLITNTKFSSRAISYGECVGMTLIGWNYPQKGNLQDLIEDSGLHPITCLNSLSQNQKTRILQSGEVLCKNLSERKDLLKSIGLNQKEIEEVMSEASHVCI